MVLFGALVFKYMEIVMDMYEAWIWTLVPLVPLYLGIYLILPFANRTNTLDLEGNIYEIHSRTTTIIIIAN